MSLCLNNVQVLQACGNALFAPVSITVAAGEIGAIMGASGAGKSTLLAAIGGHLPRGFALLGDIALNGEVLNARPAELRRIGVMFQDAVLFPHLSVGENLAFGLPSALRGRDLRHTKVSKALTQAGLAGMSDRDPATLSGGERARVALMRTLLAEPLAVLLDEPFSGLDQHLRHEMRRFVFDLIRARAIPALIVTHDPDDAAASRGAALNLKKVGPSAI